MTRLADYVMDFLYGSGGKYIYLITGRGILYLSDAAAKYKELEKICMHHEQAASYAAYAYAKCTGQIGITMISTGCASTNAVTGVLCAWQNNVPCVFISGQNTLTETTHYTGLQIRTYGAQEADIIPVVESITKYAVMITNPEDICYEMEKAVWTATHGRKGPVWIDIPIDLQNSRIDTESVRHFVPDDHMPKASADDICHVKEDLENAERPVILIGEGVRLAKAVQELECFLNTHPMPIVFTPSAVDVIGSGGHELAIGAIGSLGGSRAGNFTIQNADYILALGSRLSTVTVGQPYEKFAREAELTVVDIDEHEHKKDTVVIRRFIHSDVKLFLDMLNREQWEKDFSAWNQKCIHWKKIFPKCESKGKGPEPIDLYFLGKKISDILPEEATVLTDAGFEELIIPAVVELKDRQRMIHPAEQGTMGMALPAAIGAFHARGGLVVSINGDGSVMMNLQELQTIRHYQLPVKIIVCNNNVYAVIRKRQKDLFRDRTIGTDPSNGVSCPDFQKVAEAFEIPYMRIDTADKLEAGLQTLFETDGAMLCEIICTGEQVYLHNSYAKGKDRKIIKRSLEDQSPFMDRELLLKEMIVRPVDYE